jgi:TolA-binding protein
MWRHKALAALLFATVSSGLVLAGADAEAAKKGKAAKQAKGKAGKAAASAKGAKGAAASGKAAPEIQKKDLKKEASMDPKQDLANPNESKAATEFKDNRTETAKAAAPTLKVEDLRGKLELQVSAKRAEQINYLKQILQIGTEESEKPNLYFRLGELYWEESQWYFFKSEESSTKEEKQAAQNEQRRYQEDTLSLYQRVVNDYPRFERTDEVLFFLGKGLIDLGREEEATKHLRRLIQEYPKSAFVPNAWSAVGEYFFNKAELPSALKAYKKAEEYKESDVYGFAVYKQGWCYINTGDWDNAMERFRTVILYSDQVSTMPKLSRLSLRKEAQKDYVRAYSHVGSPREAKTEFVKIGGKDNYRQMLETLGSMYVDQGKHKDVISLFKDLISDQPTSSRNIVYQGRIVEAASKLGNKRFTVAESRTLTSMFVKVKKQAEDLKEDDPKRAEIDKDLRAATEIAETTVRRLATSYHQEARKTKQEELYGLAMELYGSYLTIFPETLYAYDMRFFYAELLYKLDRFEDAAEQYTMVVLERPDPVAKDDSKKPRWLMQAAEEAVRSYDNVVQEQDKKNPPKVAGTEPQSIPALKIKLITACERYLKYQPNGPRVVEIHYKMARIYYTYNHFEEAAPAFTDIVRKHPKHEVAVYSANLTLDIYNGLKDYVTLNSIAREFYDMPDLGDAEFKKSLRKIIEASTFKLIEQKEKGKDYLGAAEAYLSFAKDFKESEFVVQSVYNAAVNFDKGGKLDRAIQTRRYLVDNYPKHPLVPDTLFNIAETYERIADFERAAVELESFAARFPTDKRTQDALNNAGVYRRTLKQFPKAQDDFNTFLKLYNSSKDAPVVAFILCEMEDEKGAFIKAADCYFDYFKKYGSRDPERRLMAQYRRGVIFRDKSHYKKGEEEALGYFRKEFEKESRKGTKLPLANEAMASLAFLDAEANFSEYKKLGLRINVKNAADTKVFEKSYKEKTLKVQDVRKRFEGVVVTYKVAEYALAALFYIGESYREFSRALVETPVPNGLTNDQKQLYKEALKQQTLPIEDQAVDAYRNCVKRANELGIYNRWSVKSLDRLHEYRSDEFPLVSELKEKTTTKLALASAPMVLDLPIKEEPVAVPTDTPTSKSSLTADRQRDLRPELGTDEPTDGTEGKKKAASATTLAPAPKSETPAPATPKSEAKPVAAPTPVPPQPVPAKAYDTNAKDDGGKDEEPKD